MKIMTSASGGILTQLLLSEIDIQVQEPFGNKYRTRIASSSSFLRRASLDLLADSLFFRRFSQYSWLLPSLPSSLASEEESSAADGSGLKELLPPF
ncbi:hypothetical protein C0J52_19888 [Blattella germanica]|nr:hypothetical protein C0J52_19888 [Blattella germanica]